MANPSQQRKCLWQKNTGSNKATHEQVDRKITRWIDISYYPNTIWTWVLQYFLYRIGNENSPIYSFCNQGEDSAEHTVQRCTQWSEEWKILTQKLGNDLSYTMIMIKYVRTKRHGMPLYILQRLSWIKKKMKKGFENIEGCTETEKFLMHQKIPIRKKERLEQQLINQAGTSFGKQTYYTHGYTHTYTHDIHIHARTHTYTRKHTYTCTNTYPVHTLSMIPNKMEARIRNTQNWTWLYKEAFQYTLHSSRHTHRDMMYLGSCGGEG